jgi:hypothetical protein
MIEVIINKNGEQIGYIEIANLSSLGPNGDYLVKYAVERGSAVGLHSRMIHDFPRKHYNVFALVLQALNTLTEKELELERDFDPDQAEAPVSSDVARRFRGAVRSIQAGFSRRDNH